MIPTIDAIHGKFIPPTSDEIDKYINVLYPGWVDTVRQKLQDLSQYLSYEFNRFDLNLILENVGNLSADSVLLEIEVSDNFYFLRLDEESESLLSMPIPPQPPRGKRQSFLSDFSHSRIHDSLSAHLPSHLRTVLPQRDKNTFYWKDEPEMLSRMLEMECEQFRHKRKPEIIKLKVASASRPNSGILSCTISAENIPDPISLSVPIKIEYELGDTYKHAEELLSNLYLKTSLKES